MQTAAPAAWFPATTRDAADADASVARLAAGWLAASDAIDACEAGVAELLARRVELRRGLAEAAEALVASAFAGEGLPGDDVWRAVAVPGGVLVLRRPDAAAPLEPRVRLVPLVP